MYEIYDDVFPKASFEYLRDNIVNKRWDLVKNSAYTQKDAVNLDVQSLFETSFARTIVGRKDGTMLDEADICVSHSIMMLSKYGYSFNRILRIRTAMQLAHPERIINPPHVDFYEPHKVGLFYFDTCDAPTILYEKKYDGRSPEDVPSYVNSWRETEQGIEIEAKANRLIVFDGYNFHSSSRPTNINVRYVMNIVFGD